MIAAHQSAFAKTDVSDLLDTLETTTSMIQAFGVMMERTAQSGENLSLISYGMERLLNQQCEDLRAIEDALRDRFRQIKESKLEILDIQTVAQWAGVSPKLAARVISIATGICLSDQMTEGGESHA